MISYRERGSRDRPREFSLGHQGAEPGHGEELRVLGKPEGFARYYYEQGGDELLYMVVVDSHYQHNRLSDIVARTAKEIFIPMTVGGGPRTLDDIRQVLRAGADKASLNTGTSS